MLRLTDTKVNATEGNPVQDMIDLGRVAVKEEKEERRAPANTFEASFGYGWVTSKMYDINGATLDSKGGIDWSLLTNIRGAMVWESDCNIPVSESLSPMEET